MPGVEYNELQVQKGAVINECVRCGAVVFHRMIHDAWHMTNDKLEIATATSLLEIWVKLKND